MLSLFPQILFLTPFSATLLRIAAGIVILLMAWGHYQKRGELSKVPFIVIGRGMWIPILAALVECIVAVALIIGLFTQGAAIVGAVIALKSFLWKRRYPGFFMLSPIASALLFVICLSLLVTGAGMRAFDLPF